MTSTLLAPETPLPTPEIPTPVSDLVFQGKVALLRLRRRFQDWARPVPFLRPDEDGLYPVLLAESVTPLWSDPRLSEAVHQFGKVENLRRAAARFDRLAIPAKGVFSFWRQLGRATRRRGFVAGRMLQQGCLVPAVGGGLCQLSNALYDIALRAGAEIVERHAHSRVVPGSAAQSGRDATVAWNYVDFRFRMRQAALLRVELTRDKLVVRLFGQTEQEQDEGAYPQFTVQQVANDCGSCNQTACHRHEAKPVAAEGRAAFLVDEAWPEFRAYVAAARRPRDLLGIPLDGRRWNRPRYGWETEGFATVEAATWATLSRAFLARRASRGNGERVAAQLRGARAVARRLARTLTPDITEVTVAQSLLPFLWASGRLGGRRLTVLMTRLPMAVLQAKLDLAAVRHAERETLADFRASDPLAAVEIEALDAAERIVTPHAEIAALFPGKALLLDWRMPTPPAMAPAPSSRRIAFPGPSVARKGAYELREAARRLDLEVLLLGNELEGADFWKGVRATPVARSNDVWLKDVAAVVQPALIEEQPRLLLRALAAGIPVIATPACGIAPRPGLTLVPEDDVKSLIAALMEMIGAEVTNKA
jgi:hypothetical protein